MTTYKNRGKEIKPPMNILFMLVMSISYTNTQWKK